MDDTQELQIEQKSTQVNSVARRAELDTKQVIDGITPGTILSDRYEIIEALGQGGMGSVYKARHNLIGNFLAIKVLHPHLLKDAASLDRFKAEAKASIAMRHERLVSVSDYGISPTGQPFIAMEYVEGQTLSDLLAQRNPFTSDEFFDIFEQVCDGLAYVHQKGVIHRDIKPGNIMLSLSDDGKAHVHIVDFGIAKILPRGRGAVQHLTQTGEVFGSPLYMSPEQCKGRVVDERADIYSLGCVMFEALSGAPPHRGESAIETLMSHVNDEAPKLSARYPQIEAGSELEQIVAKTLMTDPDARYQNMNQIKADLAQRKFTGHNISGSAVQSLALKGADDSKKTSANNPNSSRANSTADSNPNTPQTATTMPQLRSKVLRDTFVNPLIIAAAAVGTVWLVSALNIKQPPVAIVGGINDEKLREADLEFQLAQEKASQGFTPEAAEYSQKALDLRKQLVPNSLILAESLNQRADIAMHDAEHENMLLQQKRSDTADDTIQVRRIESRKARIADDYQMAEKLLKDAIVMADAKTPESDKAGAPVRYRNNITTVYLDQNKFKYAEQSLKEISNLFLGQETGSKSEPDSVDRAFHDLFDEQFERLYWGTGRNVEAAKLRLAHHRPENLSSALAVNPAQPFTGIWSSGRFSLDLHQMGNRLTGQTPAINAEPEKNGEEPSAVLGDISNNVARLTVGNSADVRISAVAVQLDNCLVFHVNNSSGNNEPGYVPNNAVLILAPPNSAVDASNGVSDESSGDQNKPSEQSAPEQNPNGASEHKPADQRISNPKQNETTGDKATPGDKPTPREKATPGSNQNEQPQDNSSVSPPVQT